MGEAVDLNLHMFSHLVTISINQFWNVVSISMFASNNIILLEIGVIFNRDLKIELKFQF